MFKSRKLNKDPWLPRIAVVSLAAIVITCVVGTVWLQVLGKVVQNFIPTIAMNSFLTLVILLPKLHEQA